MTWTYYKLNIKLLTEMLGTCTKASIWQDHIIAKAKKNIKEANRMGDKVRKAFQKYKGDEIPPEKELAELQAVVRRFQELTGNSEEMPDNLDALMTYAKKLEEEYDALVKKGEEIKSTVFMRDANGHAQISTHMIIGNLKENFRTITNNSTLAKEKKIAKSKVSADEMITLDIKPVEQFVVPTEDVVKDENGKPDIWERPIRFSDNFGNTVTAIAASEYLPIGTEVEMHLRVRTDSPLNKLEVIEQFFDLGKNNGLGQNRRSGFGQYCFKLEQVSYNPTKLPEGGWK